MANIGQLTGDLHIRGSLTATTLSPSAGVITNEMVSAAADIAASKLEHQHVLHYSQESDTTSATEDHCIHVVRGATGSAVAFEAGSVTACTGNATITVDLHKNGATILTGVITLDSTNTAYVVEAGTIDTATLADGDVLEVVVVATVGTGALGKGVFASCVIREDAA